MMHTHTSLVDIFSHVDLCSHMLTKRFKGLHRRIFFTNLISSNERIFNIIERRHL